MLVKLPMFPTPLIVNLSVLLENITFNLLLVVLSDKLIYLFAPPFTKAAISAYNTPSVEFIKSALPAPVAVSVALVTVLPYDHPKLVYL